MSRYALVKVDEKRLRKNNWLPCAISAQVDEMSAEELVRTLKATYWADNIANSEWPAVLKHEDFSPSARSRLKKKGAGWLMALARIAYLNPELFAEVTAKAEAMYEEQIGHGSLSLQTLRNLAELLAEREPGETTCSQVWNEDL